MFQASTFVKAMQGAGYSMMTGTPCSMITSLIEAVTEASNLRYIPTSNEAEAIAVAAGAYLAGKKCLVVHQNSGLGNTVNPLTSLAIPFKIPLLILTTWRGEPGAKDEPQHETMGAITPSCFKLMGIPTAEVPANSSELAALFQKAEKQMEKKQSPFAFLLKPGTLRQSKQVHTPECTPSLQVASTLPAWPDNDRSDPDAVLQVIQNTTAEDDVVIATTGFTGRALADLEDRPNQLYMVGSMGCAAALGLGISIAQPEMRVVILDGDGSLLMHLGTLSTIARAQPKNFVHVLLDNGVNDSTGSQPTAASNVDFATVAQACGYPAVVRVPDLEELEIQMQEAWEQLTFLHVRTDPRENRNLPRPPLPPDHVATRLRKFLGE